MPAWRMLMGRVEISTVPPASDLQQPSPCAGSSGSTPDDNDDDDKFEERIAALQGKRASKQRPTSQGAAARVPGRDISAPASKPSPTPPTPKDWGREEVFLDSPPHRGDLASNIALGATLLWLPLTAAAVGRAAFVRYLVTDKRVSVSTSAPWKKEQLDAGYDQIRDVVAVGRGLGYWGDMVLTLGSGDRLELRAVPRWKEVRDYILARRDAGRAKKAAPADAPLSRGF
ncbi:hypothetical protein F751_5737 [Auxenochlorella protothecoides]|uniref:YdbS-like PH domain-containing protein n=1 Tax=Auxenochlorella protothecoides TaxID=3075 RepID=A0A087SU95_AUXPR|nr:hypothetical protein F751_5737 [Auxenochlorella protothecoides]KFM29299.1 hypothetical protein F751_5737 [Auxenochlorella protothecoides]RMZ52794.1 hypothetical protein APUTEX25_000913 [Auxenochlorella protothecoides]|eukprot:RMZ52794.1 hypothetical protein APUTEX25_000913 [Auxenochlorella protothecoides]